MSTATSGTYWVTDPNAYLEPQIGRTGAASLPALTVVEVFRNTVTKFADQPALCLKRRATETSSIPKSWEVWTWQMYWDDCKKFAKTLVFLQVEKFRVVNILGFNSPEWFIANTGSIFAGCIAAGIYTTNTPEACKYISEHSQAEVIVVEGNKQLAKYVKMGSLEHLKALVVWGEDINPTLKTEFELKNPNKRIFSWSEFLDYGSGTNRLGEVNCSDEAIDVRLASVKPGNCSTLIYTSGTTGPPKAVMISHDNITWTTKVIAESYIDMSHKDRGISYLPLSHIAAQLIDVHLPMCLGSPVYFCQPDALKGSLTATMKDVRPTYFFGVPRVWEKMEEKMGQLGREVKGAKLALAKWAKYIGLEKSKRAQFGGGGGAPCGYGCANAIVLNTIKQALGLDKCKACFTAAAPIAPETLWYFASLDIPVFEMFGQSECTGPHTVSAPGQWKIGYCGRPMYGTQSKIASNGELCYRGRHIFMGYMYMPDKTAETIDDEGYLHSGDVAEFDRNDDPQIPSPSGFMRITGRIKELIITAGGENVPPVLIENEMKAAMLAISNVMVIGDRRKFLSMLVSLKVEVDKESGAPTDTLAADALFVGNQIGSSATTLTAAAADPLWTKYINDGVKVANSKTTSAAQIVQKWKMLPVDFSEKAGELTPTLKLKRNVVSEKYAELIDSIYAGDDA